MTASADSARPHALVLGCGTFGATLARTLDQHGYTVVVLERSADAHTRLDPDFGGRIVHGDGLLEATWRAADYARATAFIACTGDDATNIVAACTARTVAHIPHVLARRVAPAHAETYARLGLTAFAPAEWGARHTLALLAGAPTDLLTLGEHDVALQTRTISAEADGQLAGAWALPGEVALVALVRAGRAQVPLASTPVATGDVLYLSVAVGTQARAAHQETAS